MAQAREEDRLLHISKTRRFYGALYSKPCCILLLDALDTGKASFSQIRRTRSRKLPRRGLQGFKVNSASLSFEEHQQAQISVYAPVLGESAACFTQEARSFSSNGNRKGFRHSSLCFRQHCQEFPSAELYGSEAKKSSSEDRTRAARERRLSMWPL